jgi:hypothetical protein
VNRAWGVLAAVLAALFALASGASAQTKTHGMVLDSVAAVVASDLLRDAAVPQGRPVHLAAPIKGDTLGVLAQRLLERLRAQGIAVRLGGGRAAANPAPVEADSGDGSSRADGSARADAPFELTARVDGAGVTYVRRIRSFPFGVKGYERLVSMRASATLVDPATGDVRWARSATATSTDLVPKRDLAAAAGGSGGINPPLPSGSGFRLLEPLIVLGVVTGLVVLFYSNRT